MAFAHNHVLVLEPEELVFTNVRLRQVCLHDWLHRLNLLHTHTQLPLC